MTTPPSLPSVNGLTWSRHKTPNFSTRIANHVSGREVRVPLQVYPRYQFELSYSALDSNSTRPAITSRSLQTLMGFFDAMQGAGGVFLYTDPTDSTQAHTTTFATGDGSTTAFTIMRVLGSNGFFEPAGWVTALTAVYVNGVALGGGTFSLATPNTMNLTSAPPLGQTIGADFSFSFQCRFQDDSMDFEEFMSNLWQLQSMKFISVKVPPL